MGSVLGVCAGAWRPCSFECYMYSSYMYIDIRVQYVEYVTVCELQHATVNIIGVNKNKHGERR
jgi:hypothetical protein